MFLVADVESGKDGGRRSDEFLCATIYGGLECLIHLVEGRESAGDSSDAAHEKDYERTHR